MLAGNVTALLSPLVFVPLLCGLFGLQRYDWKSMRQIRRAGHQGHDHDHDHDGALPGFSGGLDAEAQRGQTCDEEEEEEERKLNKAFKIACVITVSILTIPLNRALVFLVLWPMPLYGSGYIFSKPFFTGWVAVGIIWIFGSFIAVGLYPVWESRRTLLRMASRILKGMGKGTATGTDEKALSAAVEAGPGRRGVLGSSSGEATPVKTGLVSNVG
ncbi:hypothetical protein E4U41_005392 [Claviceps citrina]|nr:hypothetical protein E4U41_005392 [Claviceps citrina]